MNALLQRAVWRVSAGLLLILLIAGCSPIGGRGQTQAMDTSITLGNSGTAGQTFTATYAGLAGMRLYLEAVPNSQGSVTLKLYPAGQRDHEIARGELDAGQISGAGFVTIEFDRPLAGSAFQDYYLELSKSGEGEVRLGSAPANTYLEGGLYLNRRAQTRQIAFMPIYAPFDWAAGIVFESLRWLGWLALAAFAILLPGLALVQWTGCANDFAAGVMGRILLGIAPGFAVYPILFLLFWLLQISGGMFLAWAPGILAGLYLLVRYRRNLRGLSLKRALASVRPVDLAWVGCALAVVFSRFWAVRTLPLPMWGDSIHHSMITELIVRNGGLFASWQPFNDMSSLTYHFGFHVFSAVIHWIGGLPSPQSVLVAGQLLNILAVLSLSPLATRIAKGNPWAGVVAILVAGCLTSMPMFYTNWGRYTQLAGQVILPGAVLLLWRLCEVPQVRRLEVILTGAVWGGLALTHYRVMIFAVTAALPLLMLHPVVFKDRNRLLRIVFSGALAGLLFLPWFLHVYGSSVYQVLTGSLATAPANLTQAQQDYNAIGDLSRYLPPVIWGLTAISAAWGIAQRNKGVLLIAGWALLVVLAANPGWLGLPGSGILSNFAVFIAAYLFAACLIAAALAWLVDRLLQRRPVFLLWMVALLAIAVAILGTPARLRDIQPAAHALGTRADLRAFAWIRDNLPTDARFLVNSFSAYGDTIYVGSDGGWWLPQMTERKSSLPPMIYSSETSEDGELAERVNKIGDLVKFKGIRDAETLSVLAGDRIGYIYIGQQNGSVNDPGPKPLDPAILQADGRFELVYREDQVWIFKIRQ